VQSATAESNDKQGGRQHLTAPHRQSVVSSVEMKVMGGDTKKPLLGRRVQFGKNETLAITVTTEWTLSQDVL
jgi:hypothetical protein